MRDSRGWAGSKPRSPSLPRARRQAYMNDRPDAQRPDVSRLIASLHDPAAKGAFSDILLSLLHCDESEARDVESALVERTQGEDDTLVADAIGEALGALWAQHGAPSSDLLERLPEIPRAAAMATYAALTK